MLPTDSLPVRLKALAEKHKVYVIMAINGTVGMTVLGSMSFFVDPLLIVMISNLTNAACAALVVRLNSYMHVRRGMYRIHTWCVLCVFAQRFAERMLFNLILY